jgi:hypothetical protein
MEVVKTVQFARTKSRVRLVASLVDQGGIIRAWRFSVMGMNSLAFDLFDQVASCSSGLRGISGKLVISGFAHV